MSVTVAKTAGFCFGVRRAVDLAEQQAKKNGKIYAYGEIIHNMHEIERLEKLGVYTAYALEDIPDGAGVLIRAHGVPRNVYTLLQAKKCEIFDATCPFVKRIHKIVQKESEEGRQIVIIGNAGHPEVEGIMGWAKGPAFVVESAEEIEKIPLKQDSTLCIVSQTTFNYKKFKELVEIFEKKGYNIIVVNTICNATEERQTEARDIASKVDAMIIIGGRHSSNTRKLYEICREQCSATYFIQTLDDLHLDLPKAASLVGITAGASTPNNIIEEVQNYVRINF